MERSMSSCTVTYPCQLQVCSFYASCSTVSDWGSHHFYSHPALSPPVCCAEENQHLLCTVHFQNTDLCITLYTENHRLLSSEHFGAHSQNTQIKKKELYLAHIVSQETTDYCLWNTLVPIAWCLDKKKMYIAHSQLPGCRALMRLAHVVSQEITDLRLWNTLPECLDTKKMYIAHSQLPGCRALMRLKF